MPDGQNLDNISPDPVNDSVVAEYDLSDVGRVQFRDESSRAREALEPFD